ncbi:hypothetical protein J4443_00300 [Candidatus Woesearchaeota archaeon]|nr:hypothetical protein [Candidatus Woesearchaeota archaeon]
MQQTAVEKSELTELLQSEEVSKLPVLSRGFAQLVEQTDAISVDTSFLMMGLMTAPSVGLDPGIRAYLNRKKSIDTAGDVITISRGIETTILRSRINFENLMDVIEESLLHSHLSLSVLYAASKEYNILIPEIVLEESTRHQTDMKKRLDPIRNGFSPRGPPNHPIGRGKKDRIKGYRMYEREFLEEKSRAIVNQDYRRNILRILKQLSRILLDAEAKGHIVQDSGLYKEIPELKDHRIIDSSLTYTRRLGIATFDWGFKDKLESVMQQRKEMGLPTPTFVTLLRGGSNFVGYDLFTCS